MNDVLKQTQDKVVEKLNELRPLFIGKMELTFIARLPDNENADFVVTNDNFDELLKVVERCKRKHNKEIKGMKNGQ